MGGSSGIVEVCVRRRIVSVSGTAKYETSVMGPNNKE